MSGGKGRKGGWAGGMGGRGAVGGEGLWGERGCERWEGGGIGVWVFGVGW